MSIVDNGYSDPADYDPAYDAEKNAYECWKVAIRECRLNMIRRGKAEPRPHHPEEMQAYREGRNGRRAVRLAVGGAFAVVAALMYLGQGTPPVGKDGASVTISEAGGSR